MPSQPITATPSGASGTSTCTRSIKRGAPSSHSNVTFPPPGHGGPSGGPAWMTHSPTSASRRSRAAVFVDSLIVTRTSKCTRIHRRMLLTEGRTDGRADDRGERRRAVHGGVRRSGGSARPPDHGDRGLHAVVGGGVLPHAGGRRPVRDPLRPPRHRSVGHL